ncbi:hypothetical protein LX32DRAFT_646979 [Colletotrichum zoysiae]|uniref:Uncharacterized protein n=1 Tax=Colletotrichum zoysiae TaxID=1216348 RepID=A0AAD9H3L6_9PEZI|nr:hypothetical protein LX32DRAFT_646979 [Colletotrichum zoysiae]
MPPPSPRFGPNTIPPALRYGRTVPSKPITLTSTKPPPPAPPSPEVVPSRDGRDRNATRNGRPF